MSLSLILLSVLFTGTGIYQKLAAWGGAGALVPITGFANSVAAPAIEYKKKVRYSASDVKFFYDRRSCYPVRYFHKLGTGTDLLGSELFK